LAAQQLLVICQKSLVPGIRVIGQTYSSIVYYQKKYASMGQTDKQTERSPIITYWQCTRNLQRLVTLNHKALFRML